MYDAVCLASGGLDSTLSLHVMQEYGIAPLPVFINYGQRNYQKEWKSLLAVCEVARFPSPIVFDLPNFGRTIRTGLTDKALRVNEDAFTPNRNMLFLLLASSVAYSKGIQNVVVGLLAEKTALFPDQTDRFLRAAEVAITESLGSRIFLHCPLRDFTKHDVVRIAREKGITQFYSCHLGEDEPCGKCIACLEYKED